MKPHEQKNILKEASKLRLQALFFYKGTECLNRYSQLTAESNQQLHQEFMVPIFVSSGALRVVSLELAMKSIYSFLSTKPFKRTHDLKELFQSLEPKVSDELVQRCQVHTSISKNEIEKVLDKHKNLHRTIRYFDTGDFTITVKDSKLLHILNAASIELAQILDGQSGAAKMIEAERKPLTQSKIRQLKERMLEESP